jgi:hypothetical protein
LTVSLPLSSYAILSLVSLLPLFPMSLPLPDCIE